MLPTATQLTACELCGTPLRTGFTAMGCLGCLLRGGLEDSCAADPPRPATPGGSTAGADAPGEERSLSVASASFYQHYEILSRPDGQPWELGRGAMGVTYKALDVNLRVPVALKVISARWSAHPDARARFLREARAAALLRHANVASVFHFGTVSLPGGAEAEECFYTMEFVDGETLESRVRHAGPLRPALAAEAALQIAYALAAAERRGLVHRDLKPGNVMLTAEGAAAVGAGRLPGRTGEAWVKVIDFGLAKAVSGGDIDPGVDVSSPDGPLTQGGFLGTPQFTSPEQFSRERVDVRSDIYSLGVTLWFLLTGNLPFEGTSAAEIHDRRVHRPLPVAQLHDAAVPAPMQTLLGSMLAPEPSQRPPSAAALCTLLEECLAPPPPVTTRSPRRGKIFLVACAALLAAATAGVYFVLHSHAERPVLMSAPTAVADKSVAVLPLENLSAERDNAFFADGIQDDIVTSLAKIRGLRVVGRSSVLQFRSGAPRDLAAIGRTLEVTHALVGSVRRDGDRVLVNVQLVDTRDGCQLWAERYDRTLADTLTLQGELATEIARSLTASLSPEERARVSTRPTDSPEAYLLYLRARDYQTRPSLLMDDNITAAKLYEQAITLDPRFALAHAYLGEVLAYLYLDVQPAIENKVRARAEVEESLRLQPDLGEGHLARALCLYWTERDYDGALQELEVAAKLLPSQLDIDIVRCRIHRRQGHWREAMADVRRAGTLDHHNVLVAHELQSTATDLRDWSAAEGASDLALLLSPDLGFFRCWRSYLDFWHQGDLRALRAAAAELPVNADPDGAISYMRWDGAVLARDFAGADRALATCALDPVPPPCIGPPLPKTYLAAGTAMARGDLAQARELYAASLPSLEAELHAHSQNAARHAALGLLYAYLGREEDAVREGRRGVELMPESINAYDGSLMSSYLALIYARCHQPDLSLPLIERLLTTPGPVNWYDASITQQDLRLRWQWDPLRGDPRFVRLLDTPEPQTLY